ncbi:MAG: biotin--[acetyl-CoA-carboxylase] ligase [Campylobacterota bacterium]|nr:biotin--[acetyl-CoA-carboxylase] ligase [Campylobacterota bacterium]
MQIRSLERIDSTQRYLIDQLKNGELKAPFAVTAVEQHSGRGSRENGWTGLKGNLFLSFSYPRALLPDDLKLESASLYFTYLLKETLSEAGSKVWLKWPNDLYIDDKKIGGAITNLVADDLVYGVGLNLKAAPEGFGTLDIDIGQDLLLKRYFEKLKKCDSWKLVFRKYALEFDKNRTYYTHYFKQRVALEKAILLSDGSIEYEGQRMFSLR